MINKPPTPGIVTRTRRPGGGRKRLSAGLAERHSVNGTPEFWQAVESLAGGNASRGLRTMYAAWKQTYTVADLPLTRSVHKGLFAKGQAITAPPEFWADMKRLGGGNWTLGVRRMYHQWAGIPMAGGCKAEGCEEEHHALGWCLKHYWRERYRKVKEATT